MSTKHTLCWTDIPVLDLDRSIRFYSAVLGEDVRTEGEHGFVFGLLPHVQDQVSGCLVEEKDNRPSLTGPLIYLNANGRLSAAVAAVTEHGGKVLQPKHAIGPYGFRAIVVDSEGNRIGLHSETDS
jgi:predicted enzyme related to lactoylglutathione lyase